MARYAGGGKNTVEGCRSIDVLELHRRGYLRSSGWFSCAWTRDGERLASINVQAQRDAVTLKYQSRSYGEDWSDVEQRVAIAWTPCRFGGEQPWFVCSVAANGVYCLRSVTKLYRAGTTSQPCASLPPWHSGFNQLSLDPRECTSLSWVRNHQIGEPDQGRAGPCFRKGNMA